MTQKELIYIAIAWLFIVLGPLVFLLNNRLNKVTRAIHPEKHRGFYIFPISPEVRTAVKEDGEYRRYIWGVNLAGIVFFALLFYAKSIEP